MKYERKMGSGEKRANKCFGEGFLVQGAQGANAANSVKRRRCQ